jgi:hypothetical protein
LRRPESITIEIEENRLKQIRGDQKDHGRLQGEGEAMIAKENAGGF